MNSTNHLMIFSQPEFVEQQVRRVMAQSGSPGRSGLARVWRILLGQA